MTIGNSALILGLWSVHFLWTNYCIVRSKQFGPVLKFVLCLFIFVFLILWPSIGIVGSIIGGAAYGFLAPMFATFKAVNEGKTNKFYHCIYDGTSDTVKQSFTFVRDFMDICYHSYFSVTDDLRSQGHQDGKYFEIRSLPPFLLLLRLRRSSLHRPPPVPKLMDLPHVNRQIGVISV
ncbi:hypothetical protein HYC85_025755 [Camellia sinensis]|uniref:Uncharacterized protein n=1 Tax=Camellia sinensis TaxID=4442 RepID=A0A7J7GBV7_CAMSI|nr:hypothetical protein HYC85_025755 [Camellia sinensis]